MAELFDRYSPMVRRLLIRTLGNACDVDDLIQETFLAVIRRASTPARSLRFSELRRKLCDPTRAKNELRRRALRRFIGLGELEETHWVHDDPLARRTQRLHRALARLDSTSRILVRAPARRGARKLTEIARDRARLARHHQAPHRAGGARFRSGGSS